MNQRLLTSLHEDREHRLAQLTEALARQDQAEGFALRLLELDDEQWEAIATFRRAYAEAKASDDVESMRSMLRYTQEVSEGHLEDPVHPSFAPDGSYVGPEGMQAAQRVDRERAAFIDAYFKAKAAAGLSTQKEVAEKAGISPATVQAIESRQVRPQFRTIEKLASAFGVPAHTLLGDPAHAPAATSAEARPRRRR